MFGRNTARRASHAPRDNADEVGLDSEQTATNDFEPSKALIKRATKTRFYWALFSSFLLLVSVAFLILVELGNTSVNPTLNKIYFLKLDISDIIPVSVPNAVLINSIAQSLGLHDFYTVGLWNYCEGYTGQGTTSCSTPETLYWFNPVEIIQSQLLAGATIALPADINNILSLIRLVSNWMFGLFLTGLLLSSLIIFLLPISVYTRWLSVPLSIITFLAALLTTAAALIATVMFLIMQHVITRATQLNIRASVGLDMFVFMWIAAVASIVAWLVQMGLCCCCASRRDVRTGRRRGRKRAWAAAAAAADDVSSSYSSPPSSSSPPPLGGMEDEKKGRRKYPAFGRNRKREV